MHKAVACNRYLSRFTDSPTTRHLCGEEECVFHIYMEYERLQPLFDYLKGLLLKFWLHFSPTLLIFGHPVQRGRGKLGLAKMAIRCSGHTEVGDLSLFPAYGLACPWRGKTRCPRGLWPPPVDAGRWSPRETECITVEDDIILKLITVVW